MGQQSFEKYLGEKWHTIKSATSAGQIERLLKDEDYCTDGQTGITGKSQPVLVNLCSSGLLSPKGCCRSGRGQGTVTGMSKGL